MIDISQDLLWDGASYPNRSRPMNRSELIAALKSVTGISFKEAKVVVETFSRHIYRLSI